MTYSSPRSNTFMSFSSRKLYLAMLACSPMVLSHTALAGPEGGNIVGGAGKISAEQKQTLIEQYSDRIAIDWESFDLDADEVVSFLQPGQDSVALNRILGNSASDIRGRINADGHVVLVNPRGIVFGESAQVNVGGMLASGLDIGVDDFMNGDYVFSALEDAEGTVINRGMLQASLGGSVGLLGKKVSNEGLIRAELGSVTLAAGKEAVMTFDNSGLMGIRVTESILQEDLGIDPAVLNEGTIEAEGGRVLLTAAASRDVFSQAVNTGSLADARSVVMHDDGSFTLGEGADLVNTGDIHVGHAEEAGSAVLLGQNVTQDGLVDASSASGAGGRIELHARQTTLLKRGSETQAESLSGGQGGDVLALGRYVGAEGTAFVDASGAEGGGRIYLGGDYRGENAWMPSADKTIVQAQAELKANASEGGDGGRIIVWADESTRFGGNIDAKGSSDGLGGFAEVSGKKSLSFSGTVGLHGGAGGGTLLLDPEKIVIDDSGSDGPAEPTDGTYKVDFSFVEEEAPFNISTTTISGFLESGTDVVLQATKSISVDNAISAIGTKKENWLKLHSGGDISIAQSIELGAGNFEAIAGHSGCGSDCTPGKNGRKLLVGAKGSISTSGQINLYSTEGIDINRSLSGGAVTLRSRDSIDIAANVVTEAGSLDIHAGDASLGNDGISVQRLKNNNNGEDPDIIEGNLVISGELHSNGSDINLNAFGNIQLQANASTGGGNFKVGEADKPKSFSSNYVVGWDNDDNPIYATISTGNGAASAGSIEINATGNVDIRGLDLSLSWEALDELVDGGEHSDFLADQAVGASQVGSVTIAAGGNATLHSDWNYNDSGPFAANGTRKEGWLAAPKLDVDADENITLKGRIYDAYADGRDLLDIELTALGTLTLEQDVFTAGGNFTAEAGTFDLQADINTRNANLDGGSTDASGGGLWSTGDNAPGIPDNVIDYIGSYSSSGGDVSLTLTSDKAFTLGDITTLRTCGALSEACTGALKISKSTGTNALAITQGEATADLTSLDIGGLTTIDVGTTDINLGSLANTFAGGVSLIAGGEVTLKSGSDLTINSPVGSSGNRISQLTIDNEGSVVFEHGDELYVDGLTVNYVGSENGTLTLQDGTNSWTVSGADSGSITTGSIQNVVGEDPRFTFSGFTDL
uniref:two-partner secretion domain-containing protein n=1 Tax=Marinimicrobium locisalis TaxID=546022 RepID=UPI003221C8C5